MKPVLDRVFILPEDVQTSGGILLHKHRQNVGTVTHVGPGEWRKGQDGQVFQSPLDVKVGDRVLFSFRAGLPQELDGQKLIMMREQDIFGIIDADTHIGIIEDREAWE
jgi:chaperonin GroES